MLLVVGDHGGIVHFVDMVTGQDHHIVGMESLDKVDILVDGIGRTLIPAALFIVAFIRGEHLGTAVGFVQTPGLTVADILIQLQRLILGQNTHRINAGVYTVA